MQKTSIFGHLGQKGPFWTVFGLTVKFHKKVMSGFRETAWRTNVRTNVRTNATPKVSTTSWSRDQKLSKYRFKQTKCIVLETPKKLEKGHFWIFPKNAKTSFFRLQTLGLVQQGCGSRSLRNLQRERTFQTLWNLCSCYFSIQSSMSFYWPFWHFLY